MNVTKVGLFERAPRHCRHRLYSYEMIELSRTFFSVLSVYIRSAVLWSEAIAVRPIAQIFEALEFIFSISAMSFWYDPRGFLLRKSTLHVL